MAERLRYGRANRHRGEIEALIDGERRILCLTLGALAELETAFQADDLTALAERFATGPGREAFSECGEIIGLKGGFEFGQRPERQAKNAPFAVDQRFDLAAMAVRPPVTQTLSHHNAPKLRRPADSSAISNCTSPSWRPEYSSATI